MRILFLTSRHPFPPVGGDKLRAYNFLKYLLASGHEVHLFSLIDRAVQLKDTIPYQRVFFLSKTKSYLNCLRGLFSQKPLQVWYYRSTEVQRAIDTAIKGNGYDLIFCHLLRTAEYVRKATDIPKIIDLTDAISLNYTRVVQRFKKDISFKNFIYALEKERVLSYEREVIDSFNKSILVSQVDKEYLGQFFDVSRVEVIPNGVDLDYFSFHDGEYDRNRIIFFGCLRTVPNSDAACYFAKEIFPIVKKEVPKAKFFIVGAEPNRKIFNLAKKDKSIHITGFVDDIRPHLKSAAVSVAPLRYGAGIQNKILEAMAVGTPVVTTSIGLEGINATHEKDIMVGDSPEIFARRIVDLMKDSNLRKSISVSGRMLVEKHYSWGKILEKLNFLINNLG